MGFRDHHHVDVAKRFRMMESQSPVIFEDPLNIELTRKNVFAVPVTSGHPSTLRVIDRPCPDVD